MDCCSVSFGHPQGRDRLLQNTSGEKREVRSRTRKMEKIFKAGQSGSALTIIYKVVGDSLSMSSPTGQGYTAKLDGTDAPYKGDPGTTSVSVKRVDKNTMEETDKRDGKVISVARMMVSADGKTMTFKVEDKLHGTTSQFTAAKQ